MDSVMVGLFTYKIQKVFLFIPVFMDKYLLAYMFLIHICKLKFKDELRSC